MRVLAVVSMLMAAVASAAAGPLRVAVPELQGVNVKADALSFYSEHLAQNLRAPGLNVVTSREIATLLGFDRQKTLLGCHDETGSCMAELASALGADALVLGDIARFDDTFQINLKLVAAADAANLAQVSARVHGEVETLDAIASLAHQLGRAFFEKKGRAVPLELQTQKPASGGIRKWGWLPLGAGVAAAAAGSVLLVMAHDDYGALGGAGTPLTEAQAVALRADGVAKQGAGAACLAVGLTAVAAGAAMLIFGAGDSPAAVSLAPTPGGAAVVLSGVWP